VDESKRIQFELELRTGVTGDVLFDKYSLGIYATDASIYQIMPVAAVLPVDDKDVVATVETALKYHVSIVPRGGGTSLGGQAAGASLIIDFSKYMNRVLEFNLRERWIKVQPGIVLDELNNFLKQYKLHFAPDPATSNRATIGGMIGNNSSGSKSIVYGITRDHVLETKTLLSDGSVLNFKKSPINEQLQKLEKTKGREFRLINGLKSIIENNQEEIISAFPKIMRKVQGYNLDSFVNTINWNLSDLLTGSEGTLGIVLNAKLNLEELPAQKILCTVHFNDLLDCIRSVALILDHKPSAVEILDEDLIQRAKESPTIAPLTDWMEGDPKGILIIEFFGKSIEEVQKKALSLASDLKKRGIGYACPVIPEPEQQEKVWSMRKNGLGIMMRTKGDAKPIGFIEDAAVPQEHLPDYIDDILKFCRQRDVQVIMYAHASVGLIHVRPVLDLKIQEDIDKMKAIARRSFELVKQFDGSISGEHGDGRTRSPFLEEYFGPKVYAAFRDVKKLFDPAGIMNPGVIVNAEPIDKNLRYGTDYQTPDISAEYNYREVGSFAAAVEMCTGVGACRQNLTGLMCPSYRATRDEEHSTRGRANALRLAITGQMGEEGMDDPRLFEIMDLCLSCKGCKSECPSNVDVAKLKSEFLQKYREKHGASLRDRFVSGSTKMAKLISGWKAPIINGILKTMLFRKILEWIVGVDSRRVLPVYARKSFHNWFKSKHGLNGYPANEDKQPLKISGQNTNKVVLFDDTYMNYHDTSVGISAVELLESCGYQVILAKAGCCQRPSISHGFLKKARTEDTQKPEKVY